MTGTPIEFHPNDCLKEARLGVVREYFFDGGGEEEVFAAVEAVISHLAALGATVIPIEVPHLNLTRSVGERSCRP